MIEAQPITLANVDVILPLYERFSETAQSEYGWSAPPLPFDLVKQALITKVLTGLYLWDNTLEKPLAFMLYRFEEHRAIEINVIFTEAPELKIILDKLMRAFIQAVRDVEGWDVVSYAMLGRQGQFIRTITWYGFVPVGQAVLNFDMTDAISIQVLQQQQTALPAEGHYRLDCWQPQYAGGVAESIFEAFSKASDAKWDPRFRSLLGARKALGLLTGDLIGTFMPSCCSVLLKREQKEVETNEQVVGFCLLLQDDAIQAHIPLIGLCESERGKKIGNLLLKDCLTRTIREFIAGKNNIISIKATTDTDNFSAIHMYRRMGFQEASNYPHVYLTREKLLAFQSTRWC